MSELVLFNTSEGVATITLNRPDRLNTMVDAFLDQLLSHLEQAADDERVRAVILTGAGKAFCAGGDLSAGVGGRVGGAGSEAEATGRLRRYMRTAQLLHEMPKVTIAAVRGACAGAGLSLACAADIRIASRTAVFATAFVNVGLSGDFGGTWTLSRIIGPARARSAYLLSDRIDATAALDMGLVSTVVDDEELAGHATELAQRVAAGASFALAQIKANLNDANEMTFLDFLEVEAARHIRCSRTSEAKEATAAFLEKRAPRYERSGGGAR